MGEQPDPIIATGGNYKPPTCVAFAGTTAEGRCLSTCLPGVAAQPSLQQSTCTIGNKCAPCTDPFTGADTGACSTAVCDAPTQPPFTFPGCCLVSGIPTATCVPVSQLSAADQSTYLQDTCLSASSLCVPDEYLPGGAGPIDCRTTFLGPGACVSRCVDDNPLWSRNDCPANYGCVPCSLAPSTPGCS